MPAGRPTKYKPEYCEQARALCELGATDADLCKAFKIKRSTLSLWKSTHPEFMASLRLGKSPADDRVEQSLYHRAIGYSHPDTHVRVIDGRVVLTPITKHYPPDTKAALAWLYNRRPKHWHPKPEGDGVTEVADKIIEIIRATRPEVNEAGAD